MHSSSAALPALQEGMSHADLLVQSVCAMGMAGVAHCAIQWREAGLSDAAAEAAAVAAMPRLMNTVAEDIGTGDATAGTLRFISPEAGELAQRANLVGRALLETGTGNNAPQGYALLPVAMMRAAAMWTSEMRQAGHTLPALVEEWEGMHLQPGLDGNAFARSVAAALISPEFGSRYRGLPADDRATLAVAVGTDERVTKGTRPFAMIVADASNVGARMAGVGASPVVGTAIDAPTMPPVVPDGPVAGA